MMRKKVKSPLLSALCVFVFSLYAAPAALLLFLFAHLGFRSAVDNPRRCFRFSVSSPPCRWCAVADTTVHRCLGQRLGEVYSGKYQLSMILRNSPSLQESSTFPPTPSSFALSVLPDSNPKPIGLAVVATPLLAIDLTCGCRV